jgi:haloalkane dehalogenase
MEAARAGDGGGKVMSGMTTGYVSIGGSRVAYRRAGGGPPLLLIHGWPFDGSTFLGIVEVLSRHFTCYLPDTPGLGASQWSESTDFSFNGQADTLRRFAGELALGEYAVLAHDTGATMARLMAAAEPERITKLVLLNTEMPGHRPPWIPLYRQLTFLPGTTVALSRLLRSRTFVRSTLGFGGCFDDPGRLDEAFIERCVTPLAASRVRLEGAMRCLRGIDWAAVDSLAEIHARIQAEVLMVWGDPRDPWARSWWE